MVLAERKKEGSLSPHASLTARPFPFPAIFSLSSFSPSLRVRLFSPACSLARSLAHPLVGANRIRNKTNLEIRGTNARGSNLHAQTGSRSFYFSRSVFSFFSFLLCRASSSSRFLAISPTFLAASLFASPRAHSLSLSSRDSLSLVGSSERNRGKKEWLNLCVARCEKGASTRLRRPPRRMVAVRKERRKERTKKVEKYRKTRKEEKMELEVVSKRRVKLSYEGMEEIGVSCSAIFAWLSRVFKISDLGIITFDHNLIDLRKWKRRVKSFLWRWCILSRYDRKVCIHKIFISIKYLFHVNI